MNNLNRRVIHGSHLPAKLPIIPTAVVWLLMDRFHAGQLAWGITITLLIIIWLICIWDVATQTPQKLQDDCFDPKDE